MARRARRHIAPGEHNLAAFKRPHHGEFFAFGGRSWHLPRDNAHERDAQGKEITMVIAFTPASGDGPGAANGFIDW